MRVFDFTVREMNAMIARAPAVVVSWFDPEAIPRQHRITRVRTNKGTLQARTLNGDWIKLPTCATIEKCR